MEGRVRRGRRAGACLAAQWHGGVLRVRVRYRVGRPERAIWTVLLHLQRRRHGFDWLPFCGRRAALATFELSGFEEASDVAA